MVRIAPQAAKRFGYLLNGGWYLLHCAVGAGVFQRWKMKTKSRAFLISEV